MVENSKLNKCKNEILNCHLNNCYCLRKRKYIDHDDNLFLENLEIPNDNNSVYEISREILFKNVYDYCQNTDYKKYKNIICCICSETKITPINNICYETIPNILKYKILLNKSNLAYSFNDENFNYKYPFNELNNLVLDNKGFDYNNNKCVVCSHCNYYLKKNQISSMGLINELYIGEVSTCLQNLSYAEEILISKNRLIASIFKIQYKNFSSNDASQKKLCGNIITFPQRISELYEILPNIENLKQ